MLGENQVMKFPNLENQPHTVSFEYYFLFRKGSSKSIGIQVPFVKQKKQKPQKTKQGFVYLSGKLS